MTVDAQIRAVAIDAGVTAWVHAERIAGRQLWLVAR